jgi:hypothetical protein
MVDVVFDQNGFAFLPVYIKHKDSVETPANRFKVDSGANRNTLSRECLSKHGYDDEWIKAGRLLVGDERPTLATGVAVEDCYEVVLPAIAVGGFTGYNWPFIVSISVEFRLLLGTDTMRMFDWAFDYTSNTCRFYPVDGKRQTLGTGEQQYLQFSRPPRIIYPAEVDAVSSASEVVTDDEQRILDFFTLHYPEYVSADPAVTHSAHLDMIAADGVLDSLVHKGLLERSGGAYRLASERQVLSDSC